MKRLLVIADSRDDLEFLTAALRTDEGYSIQTAMDPDSTLHRIRAWKPSLILLHLSVSNLNWLDLIPKIRSLTHDTYVSIILVSQTMKIEDLRRGLDQGADAFLQRPFTSEEFFASLYSMLKSKDVQDTLRRAMHRIEELTSTDELTGLLNMRAAYRKGEKEIAQAMRFKRPVSLLWFDLDHFSDVNRSFGFSFGNAVLQEVALLIKQNLRSIDFIARIGGDEFLVFLGETDLSNAETVAETIRNLVQLKQFKNDSGFAKLSVSVGISALTQDQKDQKMDDLLRMAAEALRSAKASGGNRVEIYSFA